MRTEALGARPQRQSVPVGGWAIGCWVSGEGWDGREVGLTDGWGEGWREIKARRRRRRVEGREGREIRRGGMTRDFGGALFRVGRGRRGNRRREKGTREEGAREGERKREGGVAEGVTGAGIPGGRNYGLGYVLGLGLKSGPVWALVPAKQTRAPQRTGHRAQGAGTGAGAGTGREGRDGGHTLHCALSTAPHRTAQHNAMQQRRSGTQRGGQMRWPLTQQRGPLQWRGPRGT